MESQPQNPEFRINPEHFHLCVYQLYFQKGNDKDTDQSASVQTGLLLCRSNATVRFSWVEAHFILEQAIVHNYPPPSRTHCCLAKLEITFITY